MASACRLVDAALRPPFSVEAEGHGCPAREHLRHLAAEFGEV